MNHIEAKYLLCLLSGKEFHLIAAVNEIRSGKIKSVGNTILPVKIEKKITQVIPYHKVFSKVCWILHGDYR